MSKIAKDAQEAADKAQAAADKAAAEAPKAGQFDEQIASAEAQGFRASMTPSGHLKVDY